MCGLQINMPDSGTFFFISDHCHVIENVSNPTLVSEPDADPFGYSGGMASPKAG